MTTLAELQKAAPDIPWEHAVVGGSDWFGLPMFDGVMYWCNGETPTEALVNQVRMMSSKGMVKQSHA